MAISIRQHEIGIANGQVRVPGSVVRNAFPGSARDYIVEIKDGGRLRITAQPASDFASGTPVCSRCRALLS
jgi:hypothetical protein